MKFKMISLSVMLLAATSAQAQQNWTIDQIMQSAMSSHPLILGKRSAQTAAISDREGAEWQRYPTASIEANTQSGGAGLLRIEQPIWTGGRITSGINAATGKLDAAGAAVEEARQQLSLKVIAATIEALRQQSRKLHNMAGVKEHEELLARIQRRVAKEVSAVADQNLASSRLYTAANDLSATNQALNNALTQLTQLAGQPVEAVSEQGLKDEGAPPSLDVAITKALAYSPTIRRLAREEEIALATIGSKRSAYMPQLALRLESMRQPTNNGIQTTSMMTYNRAMLVLSAQPGAGLSAKSGENSAIAQLESARMAREAAERDTRDSVTQDWNELVAARLRLENANQARTMAAEVSESYARQYAAGHKTWIDVVNAVRENTQAELAMDDARAQMLTASLRLREQTGTLGVAAGTKQPPLKAD